MSGEAQPNKPHVEGRIFFEYGLPANQIKLRLYRREFGGKASLLSETMSLTDGQYVFAYDPDSKVGSLEVRAVKGENEEIPLSKPLNNFVNRPITELNLIAPSSLQPLAAEYRRLSADLVPHIGSMTRLVDAKENKERQDLTVLNRATGWDARLIALASMAERLSVDEDIKLPQEPLYGLLRAGLPSDKLLLAQVGADSVEQVLKRVRDAGIIELNDLQIRQFKKQFENFANKVRLSLPAPGSQSTYDELLKTSGLSQEAQSMFAKVYLNHRGDASKLWEEAKKAGMDNVQIRKLQVQGKLAFLARNSQAMTSWLMEKRISEKPINDPVQLVEMGFYRAEKWKSEIKASINGNEVNNNNNNDYEQKLAALIPTSYVGEKVEDRLNAYAEDMARKLRFSYPTQVVGHMIEEDTTDQFKLGSARTSTAKLLKKATAQGFRLGQTPVETFFKNHTGVVSGTAEDEFADAKQQLKTLQCVYQITPSNEAMPVMLSLGLRSADEVTQFSEPDFVKFYEDEYRRMYSTAAYTQKEAKQIYRKARQVSSVTYNLFTIASKMNSDLQTGGIAPDSEARDAVRNELIKHYPTMESLFGSMDFCECEHCRSVLSPAAYLVDLLQFIDIDPYVWVNFTRRWKESHNNEEYSAKYKKPYDELNDRRPDLVHIPLTCENTNTALPYIDIVNEILEYYVANGSLDEKAAHDTGEATTPELLAEPQNVIREAYHELRKARYPIKLPFDLWIELVRQFCNYFETPLAHILDVFRPSDTLFAPTQRFDRSSIFVESLGLSPSETALFTDADPLSKWPELYGFKLDLHDVVNVAKSELKWAKTLSRRLDVTYKDLVEIVKTGFVNPRLDELTVLYKLGVTIADAYMYSKHHPLLQRDPSTLSEDEKKILSDVEAFDRKLTRFADTFNIEFPLLKTLLLEIPFEDILVLADSDAGCNFDLTLLRYASGSDPGEIDFLKINLFVRLWRKLGWSIEETDRALQAFIPRSAPFEKNNLSRKPLKTALIYLAHLKTLDEKVQHEIGKQSRLKLLTIWSDIFTRGKNSLYSQLFLTRSMLKTDEVFDHPFGYYLSHSGIESMAEARKHRVYLEKVPPEEKIEPSLFVAEPKLELTYDAVQEVQYLAFVGLLSETGKTALKAISDSHVLHGLLDAVQIKGEEFMRIKGHLPAIQGALGLTSNEISLILQDVGNSIDTAELSLPNVSLLYRYGLLSKALKLSVQELIVLRQLSGIDPFKPLHPDPLTNIEEDYPFSSTLRFVDITEQIKESGLKIEDLDYLLRHRFDETGKYRANRQLMLTLLKALGEGVRAILKEHAMPEDPAAMTEDVLRQELGLVLPADVVERFLAMMSGTVEFTATKTGVSSGDQLQPQGFTDEPSLIEVHYDDKRHEQKLTFRGVLFDSEKDALKDRLPKPAGANPHVPSPILEALLDDVQQQALSFFEKHLQKQAPNVQPTTGFLDASDYALLFDPKIPPGPQDAQDRIRNRQMKLINAFLPFLQQRLIRQFIVQTVTAQTAPAASADTATTSFPNPALVESLLTDTRLLAIVPQEGRGEATHHRALLDVLSRTSERGIAATFFSSVDCTGDPMITISLADANTGLKGNDGNPLRPAGANSARLEGYLEVPSPGAYRFFAVLSKQDAEAEFRFSHLSEPTLTGKATNDGDELGHGLNEFAELKPGILYHYIVELRKLNGGNAHVLVQGESLSKDAIAQQLALYPLTSMKASERAIGLLTKSLQLLQSLALSERETRYVVTHASDFDSIDLSNLLPLEKGDDTAESAIATAERFAQFLRLADYSRIKRDLASGTDDLIQIFEANEMPSTDNRMYFLLAKLTRRNEDTVKVTAKTLFGTPAFRNEKPLQRLWEALQVVERFGVSVQSLVRWTGIVSATDDRSQHQQHFNTYLDIERFEIARDLKETIKARYEPEAWQRIAQPIFDKLRQHQRDALVAHIMNTRGFSSMEELYEYFLIDPGMEPVVQTSRIRLAIASVQLFIQRCLLNLESEKTDSGNSGGGGVPPSAILNADQWEWMKRYRVWEANRKIFLFPENWLEPEFRDDKTYLFKELEGTLLQGDVSNDLVEDAFLNYLKKLDELARLDIVAMHLENKDDPRYSTLHVFGRTYNQPHKYYYRRYVNKMWTPWEPITAEIEGDHLAPAVWRNRLYLFWVTFLEKPNMIDNGSSKNGDEDKKLSEVKISQLISGLKSTSVETRQVDIHLHWSEYLNGEWTSRESSGSSASVSLLVDKSFNFRKSTLIHVSEIYEGGAPALIIELTSKKLIGYVLVDALMPQGSDRIGKEKMKADVTGLMFRLIGRNFIEHSGAFTSHLPRPALPYIGENSDLATRYSYKGPFSVELNLQRIIRKPEDIVEKKRYLEILKEIHNYTLLPCNNDIALGQPLDSEAHPHDPIEVKAAIESGLYEIASLIKPVFYQDNEHTLFVEPNVTERTIEDWEEWVISPPKPGWDGSRPVDIPNDLDLYGEIPETRPGPNPWDPERNLPLHPDSVITVKSKEDWLVNSTMGLLFEDQVIGRTGRGELEILPLQEASSEMIDVGGIPLNVNPGSDLARGHIIVLDDPDGLEKIGLKQINNGLNIVGPNGFNPSLARDRDKLERFRGIARRTSVGGIGG